jgi:choline dehydrogenase-like flavoprotein
MHELKHCDVVVVGSGMSGLAVACELCRQSTASVVVMEAGPDAGREHVRLTHPAAAGLRLWLEPESDPHFHRPYETDGPHYLGLSGLRRRVGGRSIYWGGALLPVEEWALDDSWPAAIVADLVETWRGGPPLYSLIAEEISSWSNGGQAGADMGALTLAGHTFHPTPHAVRDAGNGRRPAFSPLETLASLGGSNSPVIVADCEVQGVLVTDRRVTGVRARLGDRTVDVHARRVVLAAGTVENSRLAIQALTGVGDLPGARLIGLIDKIAQGFAVNVPAALLPPELRRAASLGTTFHRPMAPSFRSNQFVRLWTLPDDSVTFDTWLMGEQRRSEAGSVRCEPASEWPWRTFVTAGLGPDDEILRATQQEFLTEFWKELAATIGVSPAPLEFDAQFGSHDLAARMFASREPGDRLRPTTYAFPLGSEQHEAGTTPLGGLLDANHEFKSIRGLSAAGPSSFPRSGAANPAMTILALAKRLGAILSLEMKQSPAPAASSGD